MDVDVANGWWFDSSVKEIFPPINSIQMNFRAFCIFLLRDLPLLIETSASVLRSSAHLSAFRNKRTTNRPLIIVSKDRKRCYRAREATCNFPMNLFDLYRLYCFSSLKLCVGFFRSKLKLFVVIGETWNLLLLVATKTNSLAYHVVEPSVRRVYL